MAPTTRIEPLESRTLLSAVLEDGTLTVTGGEGNDTIRIASETVTVNGQPVVRLVVRENGVGTAFDDFSAISRIDVSGAGGNDTIDVGPLSAGGGSGVRVNIDGGDGNDTITARTGAPDRYTIDAGRGNDRVSAVDANIDGGLGDDVLGLTGRGRVRGGGDNDTISTDKGIFTTGGGRVRVSGSSVTVIGTESADTVRVAREGADGLLRVEFNGASQVFTAPRVSRVFVNAFGGDDDVRIGATGATAGFAPRTIIRGGDGNDTIAGGDGNDTIFGDFGHDVIDGRGGDDFLQGLFGDDQLAGAAGRDIVDGGGGNDTFLNAGGNGRTGDVLLGGPGLDKAEQDPDDVFVSVEMAVPDLA